MRNEGNRCRNEHKDSHQSLWSFKICKIDNNEKYEETKNIMFYIIFMTLEFMLDLISNVYFNVN